jgi:ATP-binding cassette subfamily B protein
VPHPLQRLWRYAEPHRRQILLAIFCSILNKLFDLAPPVLIGTAVDVVVRRQDSIIAQLGFPDLSTQLLILAVATAVVWSLESLFEYLFRVLWRNLAQTLQHELRIDAYDHVQHLELAYFEEQSTGTLMSILNDDINQLERFLDEGANDILQVVTTTLVIGAFFVVAAPSVGWMTVLPMPFIAWGSIYFQRKLAPLYARVREQVGILNSHLSNNLGGITTIKSFTNEEHELRSITRESDEYRTRNRDAIALSSAFVPVIRMIIVTGFIAILYYGGSLTLAGQIQVATYSVMIFMTQRLLWPLTRLGSTLDLYQRAMASIDRVFNLLDTPKRIRSGDRMLPVETVRGEIVFEHVGFAYRGIAHRLGQPVIAANGHGANCSASQLDGAPADGAPADGAHHAAPIIRNLSLRIAAGETAAIVGATGAGKSTVVKLLLRLYDVQEGRILLDGHDLRELYIPDLRRAIGFVSQDVFLFHGTVRENIAYGDLDATDASVVAAAKAAEAHDFIMELPEGYDTIVGERGQRLSGGQRQRLSIARAVLKDPPVLILDEATSAVDNETEAAIQRSLERIAIGRTTIVIAHRLSTVRNADCIFVLENGALKEQGRHEDLLAEDGIYAALWRVQTGDRSHLHLDLPHD